MEFVEMRDMLIEHFKEMTSDTEYLYEVELNKDELWNLYLDSFPKGTNEIYRERREHDCNCCKHFIRIMGNVVKIKDDKVTTIWDFKTNDTTYQPVLNELSKYVKAKSINNVFYHYEERVGTSFNYDNYDELKKWEHFYLDLPSNFIKNKFNISTLQGKIKGQKNVFKRSLEEITLDAIDTVLELINSNTLYRGNEWKHALSLLRQHKIAYDKLKTNKVKDLYVWEHVVELRPEVTNIRNHSIGLLLQDISANEDLNTAVRKYESVVAPSNYKRPKEIFTKKMLEDAKQKIVELGYLDSLSRRFATLDDITINNILFSNKDSSKRILNNDDIFAQMEKDVISKPKKFTKVEEIGIEKFISDVLPTTKELEVYLENKHSGNLVSLIAPQNKDSKTMFKWNNNFSWAYSGNLADSMKERVKAAGGKVDGVLRFSIQWNEDGYDNCDLDAHAFEPTGTEIYFATYRKPNKSPMSGELDVDIINPSGNIAVENITWSNKSKMKKGTYKFFVHQYSGSAKKGFRAEIEFDGQIHSFDYSKPMRRGEIVDVAEVTLDDKGNFTIKELLPSNVDSKNIWGLKTNSFVPVSVMMLSPNYWDEQNGNGNKHYFFMLKDCLNPETPNGMFNEYLKNELLEHKRVFAALGSKMKVEEANDQLSGLGFSSTKRNELIVKTKGSTERVLKIKF